MQRQAADDRIPAASPDVSLLRKTTCAELPEGVPHGQSGPHLMAFTTMLMAYFRQSKRRTAEFLGTLLG